ncbi:MAG TPA: hypothetical protein VFL04_02425 [Rectinemataceae bacterium]|nr:hypothetical protein [Rectinemataceae bacterium]
MKPRVTLLVLALGAAGASAQDAGSLSLNGSLSAQPYAAWSSASQSTGAPGAGASFSYGSTTSLGLELAAKGQSARAAASIEAAVLTGQAAADAWAIANGPFARADELLLPAPQTSGPAPETLVAARIRSLYVKVDGARASLIAGRQVINYGRGALWNPADIFTELDLTGLSPVRRGSDALRLLVPLGPTEGLDLVAAPLARPAEGRYAIRASGVAGSLDGALIAARDGQRGARVAGADFKTDLELGVVGDAELALLDSGRRELRAAGGLDYSIGEIVMAVEYYYNGGGAAADPLFPASHNAYASATWEASQLASASAVAIVDLGSASGSLTLLGDLSLAQNAELELFAKGTRSGGPAVYGVQAGFSLAVKF